MVAETSSRQVGRFNEKMHVKTLAGSQASGKASFQRVWVSVMENIAVNLHRSKGTVATVLLIADVEGSWNVALFP